MKNIELIKWLLKYAKKRKIDFFLYCLIGMLMVVVWLILPIIISKQTLMLTGSSFHELYRIGFIIFGIHFFYSILKYFISFHAQKFITETYKNLHLDITKNFMNTKYEAIHNRNIGFYIERMTDDTIDISDFFINITDDLIDLFINIGSLITIFLLNKIIFLFYVYFLILLFIVKKTKTHRYAEEVKKKRESVENLMDQNIEIIHSIKEIKLLNLKKFFQRKIEKKVKDFNITLLNVGEVERFFRFITMNVRNIFRLLLISLSIYLISNKLLTISVTLIAFSYEDSIFGLLDYTESLLKNIRIFKLSANRIRDILDPKESPKEIIGTQNIVKTSQNVIELNNISFAYLPENNIIKNFSLTISKHQSIAFVGLSGCGKTTIFYLLTRLYTPVSGHIKLYDQELNSLKEEEIRKSITIVSQNPYLFRMSIEKNLKLNKNISQKEIEKYCKIAQIHDEIMNMEQGYRTIIQDNGSNLSGGQKQRLAIARALIQDTPIILFDEATSALDNETQEKLKQELQKIKNKTIITIAHRLSTIINSDQIVVLSEGKINDIGTHQELLKRNKIYQTLYNNETKSN